MIKIKEVIVVEGKYDKISLSQAVDARIIVLGGFGIYKNEPLLRLLRDLAEEPGLIVLTDSDGSGFQLRSFLKSAINVPGLKQAYIPDIKGKERRKTRPSAQGKLGVEGMDKETLISALLDAGATIDEGDAPRKAGETISKADLFELGLSGGENSAEKRKALQKALNLPELLSANMLLDILNLRMSKEELLEKYRSLFPDG